MSKRLLFYFLIFLPYLLYSQQVWTLEDCIQHSHEYNLEIKQVEITKDLSHQNLLESKGNLIPSLNGSANHNYNFGRTIDPFTNQFTTNGVRSNSFSIFGSLTLFNGFQILNTIRQNEYEMLASQYDLQLIKNNIALNITSAYLQILFNSQLVQIAENQRALTTEQLDRMRKLVAAGKSSPVVIPDLEAQLASEEVRLVNAQNQLKLGYLTLAQLINLNPEEEFKVLNPEFISLYDTSALNNTNEVFEKALMVQPQIKSADYRRLSSQRSYAAAKGRRSPRLVLNASISTIYASSSTKFLGYQYAGMQFIGYTSDNDSVFAPVSQAMLAKKSFNSQFSENLNKFVGFTLTVPVLNNFQVNTSVARARLGIQNAELNLQIEKNNLQRSIIAAHVDAANARKRMDASVIAVRASEEALRNAQRRLEVGQINSFDYAQVKNKLAQSQSDLLQSRYDYIFRSKILDFYAGMPLKL